MCIIFNVLLLSFGYSQKLIDTSYYKDGKIQSLIQYELGLKNGYCLWFYPNGNRMIECYYKNDRCDSLFRYWDLLGNLLKESYFKEGKENGISRKFYPSGKVMEELEYKDGYMHGTIKRFYESGKPERLGYYSFDTKVGEWTDWWENGSVRVKGYYNNGKMEGVYQYFNEDGTPRLEEKYVDDVKTEEILYKKGKAYKKIFFEKGVKKESIDLK